VRVCILLDCEVIAMHRINPVVVVMVLRGDNRPKNNLFKILLEKYLNMNKANFFELFKGFDAFNII
jgi:hypothetical protein